MAEDVAADALGRVEDDGRLAEATEDVLTGALRAAWNLRVDKNAKTGKAKTGKKAKPRRASRSRSR